MDQSEELIRAIQKGLLQWYDFKQASAVLYIGDKNDAIAEMLTEKNMQTVCASCELTYDESWQQNYKDTFDYIIAIAALELQLHPASILCNWKDLLKMNGRMLLGMNNRFGIRYFCGDRDIYTERNFDSIEGYRRAYSKKEDVFKGRCYSKAELRKMLQEAGWGTIQFYSVLSDLLNPSLIYAEDYLPNEDLANRVFPVYHYAKSVFLEEESLYASIVENGMFHEMANAYLIECSIDGGSSNISQVTSSLERGKECAVFTMIHKDGIVEKRAAYPEGQKRLKKLVAHMQDLSAHGISVVDTKLEHDVCIMPYIDKEVGQVYLKRLLQTDKEKFLQELDHFRDLILQSSDIVKPDEGDGEGAILRRGYLDMVPLNTFYKNGTFVFYDQEFCEENYPANAIITRMIATFYSGNTEFEKLLPINTLFERYGLTKKLDQWRRMEWEFLADLRKERELSDYHKKIRRNGEIVNSNRQRMNYSVDDYQRLFIDIFHHADTRKLILFGSGNFAKKFMDLYQQYYPVFAIIDNKEEKWGQEIDGIKIQSPNILRELGSGEYKVLICIKNYLSVMKQLDAMGVVEYSIFDSSKDYAIKRNPIVQVQNLEGQKAIPKKYHIGYISGVFDLFHIGHLNMFKHAKEQCEYLIVGVVSDEGVRKFKEVEPFIPFKERIELVRACRYVDEAVEIPLEYRGSREAFHLHHFDCQFSGSDYIDNPVWLADKEYLEKNGAEMVFFPYTQSTSSTKIKALIDKGMI